MSKALELTMQIASTSTDRQRFAEVANHLVATGDAARGGCIDKGITAGHLAAIVADKMQLASHQVRDAYDLALLRHAIGGTDFTEVSEAGGVETRQRGRPVGERRWVEHRSHIAHRLSTAEGLSEGVAHGLTRLFERWDGKGHPVGLVSDAIDVAVCVAQVAADAPCLMMIGCPLSAIRAGRRKAYAPRVVDALTEHAAEVFDAVAYPTEKERRREFTRRRLFVRTALGGGPTLLSEKPQLRVEPEPQALSDDHGAVQLPAAGPTRLTAREKDVIRLLPLGLTNKEIAAELGISVKTAGRHLENIFRKLQVTTRSAAASIAIAQSVRF